MKNPLKKRYSRDLRKNFGRYSSIFLMLMVTIAFMSAFFAVTDGVVKALKENRKESKVEDGLFSSYQELDADTIDRIEEVGVSIYENYYVNVNVKDRAEKTEKKADENTDKNVDVNADTKADTNVDIKADGEVEENTKVLRIYTDRQNINLVTVMKGSLPNKDNEIAIERLFAENNKLSIGDIITVDEKNMKITGYISTPDHSAMFEKNSNIMMDAFHFGIGIITDDAFMQYPDNRIIYNYSYRIHNRNLTEKERIDLSKQLLERIVYNKVALTNFCTAEHNSSITFIDDDLGSDGPLMKVMLYIIIIIMAFVYSIVISSTIDSEAAIIGTLLSNGYSKYELIGHYMGLPILVTLVSAITGNLLGYTVMPLLFKDILYSSFSLPPMELSLHLEALFLTTVVPVLIMISINFFTLNRKMSISPLSFLRKDLQRNKKRRAIKLPNLTFLNRFRIRVIIQNKSNFITLFIGIFFANVIMMFGLSISPVIDHYLDSVQNTTISQYQYILKTPMEPVEEDQGEQFTFASLETYYKAGNKNIEVSFYGVIEKTEYLSELSLIHDEDGAYFSEGLVKKLKKNLGDVVTFKDPYTGDKYRLKIKGIYQYPAGLTVLMNQEQMNEMFQYGSGYFNGYFSDDKLTFSDENILAATIKPEDMTALGVQMASSFSQMIPICVGIAVIIYFVLMYLLTKIVIEKNAIHMSFMKVFGYDDKEIKKLYLTPTTIAVVISLILGLPLSYVTIQLCLELVFMKISGYIPVYIPWYLFVEIVVIGLLSYSAINYYHKKKVGRIEMGAALKNRE